jgi:hypothetical protein
VRWWRRDRNGAAKAAAEQEAKLRAAQRMTPVYERLADALADLPAEELADRVRRALTVRHP